jgi:hypothetical protein
LNNVTLDSQHDLRRLALRRYHAAELTVLEERLMLEDGYAERLREAEYDLIDDYAAGRLDAGERADVEHHLLAGSDGVLSLRVAHAMAARRQGANPASLPPMVPPPVGPVRDVRATTGHGWRGLRALRWQGLAAVLVATLAITYQLRLPAIRGTEGVPPTQAGPSLPPAQTTAPTADVSGEVLTVSLALDQTRGEAERVVHMGPSVRRVRVQAEVGEAEIGDTYAVEVSDAAAATHTVAKGLSPRVAGPYRFVEVTIPREQWPAGVVDVRVRDEQRREDSPRSWSLRVEPDH